MTETLPLVVDGVRGLIKQGVKPTQQNCRSLPGFYTVQRYVSQAVLVAMANQKEEVTE